MTIDQHDSIQYAFQSTIGSGKFATRLHRERMFVLFKRYFTDPSSLGVALWGEFLLHYPGYLHGPKYVAPPAGAWIETK